MMECGVWEMRKDGWVEKKREEVGLEGFSGDTYVWHCGFNTQFGLGGVQVFSCR